MHHFLNNHFLGFIFSGFADHHMIKSLLADVDNSKNDTPQVPPRPSGNTVSPNKPVPSPRSVSPRPVPAPRRSKSPNTNIEGQGDAPVVPPRPNIVSPGPDGTLPHYQDGQAQGQNPPQQIDGHKQQYLNIGTLISDGIGGVKCAVGNALSDISGYLQVPKKPPPDTPVSPFEYVPKPGENLPINTTHRPDHQLYPQLSVEFSGPCTSGLLQSFGKFGAGIDFFFKPFGLAVGNNGEFVVTDRGGNRIFVFSNNAEQKYRFAAECTVNDVAITKSNEILIAVSKSGSAIMRMYTMEGHFIKQFGDFYKFDQSSGIVVTPSDHVAITNLAANNVLLFTSQRKFSLKFGSKGAGEKHFNQPSHVTATSKDYIIVSDTGNNCLKLFDKEGNFKRNFGGLGNAHGKLNSPLGIACDLNDNVFVADSNNFRVECFTVKGFYFTTLVEDTYLIGPDVKPVNVAVTPRNNIAVLLYGTGFAEVRVYSWKPNHRHGV